MWVFCLFGGVKKVVIAEKSLKGRHYLSQCISTLFEHLTINIIFGLFSN